MRDSLLGFVEGAMSAPKDLVATVQAAFAELSIPPPSVWSEVLASGSLMILSEPDVREAISICYGTERLALASNLSRADDRGRDKFVGPVYQLGLFEPSEDGGFAPADVDAFREWPGMRNLLLGLGSGHGVQRLFAGRTIEDASTLLDVLPR